MTGLTGRQRNTLEQFYTHYAIARQCIKTIDNIVPIQQYTHIVEPSAGLGVFLDELKSYSLDSSISAFDIIASERDDITTQDFLTLSEEKIDIWRKNKTLVFGNPPFGRQSSLVRRFIIQSTRFADTIAFILPRSFLKQSLQKMFPLRFHLEHNQELPSDCFQLSNGKRHHVPCVFQIWRRHTTDRIVDVKLTPCEYYQFTSSPNEADCCFRRVGVYAGQVSTHTEAKSPSSHYFIQFSFEVLPDIKERVIQELCDYPWNSDQTVGPKSISKQEMMGVLNKLFTDIYEKAS